MTSWIDDQQMVSLDQLPMKCLLEKRINKTNECWIDRFSVDGLMSRCSSPKSSLFPFRFHSMICIALLCCTSPHEPQSSSPQSIAKHSHPSSCFFLNQEIAEKTRRSEKEKKTNVTCLWTSYTRSPVYTYIGTKVIRVTAIFSWLALVIRIRLNQQI